jgi:hypothetical protein
MERVQTLLKIIQNIVGWSHGEGSNFVEDNLEYCWMVTWRRYNFVEDNSEY